MFCPNCKHEEEYHGQSGCTECQCGLTPEQVKQQVFDDLEKRVQQFNTLSLPGQMRVMHMGTSYLVHDLWREVQRLRAAKT